MDRVAGIFAVFLAVALAVAWVIWLALEDQNTQP